MLLNNRYEYNPPTDLIGKGGMAEVYKAYDRQRECYVALKMFTTPDNLKYTIRAEFQKSLQFAHGNIVRAYDFFTITRTYDDGHQHETQYGVMELVEGGDLTNYLLQKPHPAELIEVVKGILEGLHYLHTPDPTTNKGTIIHRDIKPGNILIFRNNEGKPIPKIADFNVAKEVSAGSDSSISMVGTYEYMAPEQLNATKYGKKGKVQPNADLWALGVMLCDYFLGTSVFGRRSLGNTQGQIIGNILDKELPIADIKKLRPPFDQLILKCLVRHAAERAQTAKELITLIDAEATVTGTTLPEIPTIYSSDPPDKGPTPTPKPPKPPGGGNALFQVIGVLAVVLVTVLLTLYLNKGDTNNSLSEIENGNSNTQATNQNLTADPFANDMVYVQGGTFTMGCTSEQGDDCFDEETPPHTKTVSGFYMGKYEVTQAQWRQVMGSNPPALYNKGCDQCPVDAVSHDDIQQFLKKLNQQTGKSYRLPTEAEWEYAARGGNKSKGYKYAGSNNVDAVAWYWDNYQQSKHGAEGGTHPVGTKAANELGLYDMSGNVWEWCQDWYKGYPGGSVSDYTGSNRLLRGGSWGGSAVHCRVAYRSNDAPASRYSNCGFRVALVP